MDEGPRIPNPSVPGRRAEGFGGVGVRYSGRSSSSSAMWLSVGVGAVGGAGVLRDRQISDAECAPVKSRTNFAEKAVEPTEIVAGVSQAPQGEPFQHFRGTQRVNVARATIQWIVDSEKWIMISVYRVTIHYQLSVIH